MLFKKPLFALVLAGGLATTQMSMAAPRPVFGYVASERSCALTINGRSRIQLEQIPPAQRSAIQQDVVSLARSLNQASQTAGFSAQDIQPVIVGGQHEIRHGEQVLVRLSAGWGKYRKKHPLAAMLDLTNQIRKQLGAAPLRNYAFLGSSNAHQTGLASWYGGQFHGRRTANGERYNIKEFTAAHKQLPFGTRVLVTNLDSRESVVVKINDRGPFVHKRIIDLSPAAFNSIGRAGQGVMRVKLTVLS